MIKKVILLPTLATLALAIGITACDENTSSGTVHGHASAAVAAKPTTAGLIRRCEERWAKIISTREEPSVWIEIYEYETPVHKMSLSLPEFLSKKTDFIYTSPTKPKLLLMEDDLAYLDISVQWLAGLHPLVGTARDVSKEMVKPMDMIEEWQWINDEWYFVKPHTRNEFFRENPDFLARAQAAASAQEEK